MKTALTPAEWTVLQDIVDRAADLPGEERSAYLDRACAAQPQLRARAESLLAAIDSDSGTFMHSAIRQAAALKPSPPAQPRSRFAVIAGVGAGIVALLLVAAALAWLAIRTRQAENEAKAAKQASDFLAGVFDPDDPHAREILDRNLPRIEASLKDSPDARAYLLDTVGGIYTRLGALDEANRLLTEAVDLRRNTLHREDADLATSLSLLAANHVRQTHWSDAEKLYRDALRVQRNASTLAALGSLLAEEGKLLEAETLSTAANLESVYLQEGKYAKAEALARTHGGPNLALALAGLGRFDEAEQAARNAQDALTLARVLNAAGKSAESAQVAKQIPDPMAAKQVLGKDTFETGDPAKARKLFDEVLAARQKTLPPGNLRIAESWLSLAEADAARADYAAAGMEADRADKMFQLSLGHSSPLLSESHVVLSEIEAAEGHWSQAQVLAQEALEICRSTLPPDHPLTARVQAALGWTLWKQGQTAEAAPLLESAYKTDHQRFLDMSATRQSARVASNWAEFNRAKGN
ncbi:MAG TPA: tetratricopeptide repeat protein [Bryobacteraceae bacterium]|nr:tetratricopeptide repeat protein [Bryobacteraceae bacterium]